MKKKTKPKWFPLEQRGSSKEFPLMPAVLTLYRVTTSEMFVRATGVKCGSFLLDFALDGAKNYVREDEWKRFCNRCYSQVRKNPKIQKELAQEFVKRVPKFLAFCKKIYKELKNDQKGNSL